VRLRFYGRFFGVQKSAVNSHLMIYGLFFGRKETSEKSKMLICGRLERGILKKEN